jgi:hypothetical protein
MTTKIVCRVLSDGHVLLGWVEHWAAVPGDGYLRAAGPVSVPIATAGRVVTLSLHWCDVNIEVRVPGPDQVVSPGDVIPLFPTHAPMIKVGDMPGPLPAVTVGSIAVGIPVGSLGASGAPV